MEWTLAILFAVSTILLIISILNSAKTTKARNREIDTIHISITNEINEVKDSIRNIEIDLEMIYKETGIQLSTEKRLLIREVIDLYKRKYSIESIAAKMALTESEIEQLLAPYKTSKDEKGGVPNEN